ncbi:hypothetical protein [Nostoc sp.]|uniref:hypothetical protein n=1 Tax=Nostoc sp. TaxID=1180 RepID=UPI002FF70097
MTLTPTIKRQLTIMESTLFTTLTPNEEANLSGGTTTTFDIKLFLAKISKASNTVSQTATGGKGGAGGAITIGGSGKDSPVVLIGTTVNSSGGAGGSASNTSNNAVGAG